MEDHAVSLHYGTDLSSELDKLDWWRIPFLLCIGLIHILEGITKVLNKNQGINFKICIKFWNLGNKENKNCKKRQKTKIYQLFDSSPSLDFKYSAKKIGRN